jgi:lipopolysaccharide export system permease protein
VSANADTIRGSRARDVQQTVWYFKPYLTSYAGAADSEGNALKTNITSVPAQTYTGTYLDLIPAESRTRAAAIAASHARNIKGGLDGTCNSYKLYTENLLKVETLIHKKFTLSFACVLLFLIGAPLGSIIRKGGLGLPILVAIVFFMGYYLLSVMGERLAISGQLPPWVGMWLSTATLLPIALLLLQEARNDSRMLSKETFSRIGSGIVSIAKRHTFVRSRNRHEKAD